MDLEKSLILFLVLLNPFGQAMLLRDLMEELDSREFLGTYGRATALSLGIYLLFILVGDFLLRDLFQVRLPALQIFGGLLMVVIGFRNLLNVGPRTNILLNLKAADLAPEISLPYIIGPATIWLCVLIGRNKDWHLGMLGVSVILFANWLGLSLLQVVFQRLKRKSQSIIGKYFSLLMRTTALLIGAIGIDMMIGGFEKLKIL
jgi:multiple antibiotic resistance protein